jgi:hypothetical protein
LRLASTTVDTAIASLRQLAADNFAMAGEGKAHVAQQQQQIQPEGPKASDE